MDITWRWHAAIPIRTVTDATRLGWRRYALRIPGMTLALGMLQPLIQGIIEEKTAGQHFLVVGVQSR